MTRRQKIGLFSGLVAIIALFVAAWQLYELAKAA